MAVLKRADMRAQCLGVIIVIAAGVAGAATPRVQPEDIQLSTGVLESDARNDEHIMTGNVRITQGAMSIESEQATVRGLQTESSRWKFERSVHIRTAEADLLSDTADIAFAAGRIADATVRGSPARFEQLNAASADKNVRGRARVIEYDFARGTVKMTQDVWFSYGGNEFRGDTVIYNLNEERVTVNPGSRGNAPAPGGRVNITIKPGSPVKLPGARPKPEKGGNSE